VFQALQKKKKNMRTRPLLRADLPSCADLAACAFIDNPLYAWLCPHRHAHPADFRASQLRELRARFVRPAYFGFVCVSSDDDDNQGEEVVLGYAFWARMGAKDTIAAGAGAGTPTNKWWCRRNAGLAAWVERGLLEVEERYVSFFGLDRSCDPVVGKAFANTVAASTYFDPLGDHWHLYTLGVVPERQRKGVGSLLLRWGLERAREEGLPVSLISSEEGRKLYAKYGFKVVHWDRLAVENELVGGAVMVLDEERRWVRDVGEEERIGRGRWAVEVAWIGAEVEVPREEEKVGMVAEQQQTHAG